MLRISTLFLLLTLALLAAHSVQVDPSSNVRVKRTATTLRPFERFFYRPDCIQPRRNPHFAHGFRTGKRILRQVMLRDPKQWFVKHPWFPDEDLDCVELPRQYWARAFGRRTRDVQQHQALQDDLQVRDRRSGGASGAMINFRNGYARGFGKRDLRQQQTAHRLRRDSPVRATPVTSPVNKQNKTGEKTTTI